MDFKGELRLKKLMKQESKALMLNTEKYTFMLFEENANRASEGDGASKYFM